MMTFEMTFECYGCEEKQLARAHPDKRWDEFMAFRRKHDECRAPTGIVTRPTRDKEAANA